MEKCAIIELHKNGLSNRKIAKEIHISRTTVNKYISIYENNMKRLNQTKDVTEILFLMVNNSINVNNKSG